jgi:hypothetical protein
VGASAPAVAPAAPRGCLVDYDDDDDDDDDD